MSRVAIATRLRHLVGVTAVCVAVTLLPSCGAVSDLRGSSDGAVAVETDTRGMLRISHDLSWGGDESLDPSSSSPMTWATTLLYDGLVRRGPAGEPVPGLAHSWFSNGEATHWRFSLAEDVVFHDGSAFGADDVKFTFERIASSPSSPIAGSLAALERVEVVDDLTVNFVLSQRSVDFPLLLTDRRMRVLSSESPVGVGTGPFRVDTFDPENTTIFVAHDEYFGGRPLLAGFEILAMPDASGRLAAMEAHRLDLLDELSANEVDFLAGRAEFELHSVPSGDWRGLVFDTRVEPYDDPRVMRALKLVIDRAEMIELVAGGREGAEVSCDSPVWSADPYYSRRICPPDVDRARSLLAEAGYEDGLDVTITTASLYSDWIPLVEVFQYQAAQAGVRVTVDVADADGYWTEVWMKKPVTTTTWTQRTAEQILTEAFLSDAAWNESRWNNPEFDELVHAATGEVNDLRRAELYAEALDVIRRSGGTIIPYHIKRSRVIGAGVTGVENGVDRFRVPWHEVAIAD